MFDYKSDVDPKYIRRREALFILLVGIFLGRDGAVIQYELDGNNQWENLGSIGDGINWFNSSTIQSQPGGQFFGWSNYRMEGWESARISLDGLKNETNVRFRIAYASDGNAISPFDGFAFDDFWIGNRKKELLVEYFTNNATNISNEANTYMKELGAHAHMDINPIHYHTSSPAGDPLYQQYPSGPSSREMFYGISSIPFALVNGILPFDFSSGTDNLQLIQTEMLKDPVFAIDFKAENISDNQIDIEITCLEDLSGNELVLHAALVQKAVEIDNAPNGIDNYYNVLRQFLPDPGGTPMESSISKGQTLIVTVKPEIPLQNVVKDMRLITFIQDIETGEIYQSGYLDLSDIVTYTPVIETLSYINIYPNPAVSHIWIDSPLTIEQISVIDITGRVVDVYKPDMKLISIPVNRLKNGIYMLKLETTGETVIKRFVKH